MPYAEPQVDPAPASAFLRPHTAGSSSFICFRSEFRAPVLDHADRRHALTDNLGNFLVIQILDEAQDDDLPLLFPEAQDGLPDQVFVGRLHIRAFGVNPHLLVDDAIVKLRGLALRAQVADAQVVGDTQQPRDERRPAHLVARNRFPRAQEGLGGQVFSLCGVPTM